MPLLQLGSIENDQIWSFLWLGCWCNMAEKTRFEFKKRSNFELFGEEWVQLQLETCFSPGEALKSTSWSFLKAGHDQ